MIRYSSFAVMTAVGLCLGSAAQPQLHAEPARPFVRVYYRWDREWQQGPFVVLFEAREAMNRAFERGDQDVQMIHEPVQNAAGDMTGVQYYVRGVTREPVRSRDFTSRAEAKRFYDFQRQSGFKVAHKVFQ